MLKDEACFFQKYMLWNVASDVVSIVKYLGHILISDLCDDDDDDVKQKCYKLYMQANMLAHKFYMCTFFKPIVPFYTHHLWCNYSKAII